jgi:hypothetical protein
MPGAAKDVGIGADGAAWVIGTDLGIYRFEGSNWAMKPGGAAQIAAGPNGIVWVVNDGGAIYQAQVTTPPTAAPIIATVAPITTAAPVAVQSGPIVVSGTTTSIPVTGTVAVPGTTTTGTSITGGTLVVGGAGTSPTTGTASSPPPRVNDPNAPWKVFARGYTYEAQILQAIGFQRFKSLVFLNNAIPSASQLSPLEQAVAAIALSATESYFAPSPLAPDDAIVKVKNDAIARKAVITFIGMGISARVRTTATDAPTVALRQWAAEVFRLQQIATAKGVLDEYRRWNRDPCGYEGLPPTRCTGYSAAISAPRPPKELIQKNGLGVALAGVADEVASAAAIGFAAAGLGASAAALATGLGVTAIAATTVTAASGAVVTIPAVSTSLFAAFGGLASTATAVGSTATTTASASAAAGAIGGTSWAGVIAAPIAAAVAVVVVGTVEGFAVVEAARVEPMLKLKLGAAMNDTIVIQNELSSDAGRDFFMLSYEGVALKGFDIPPNTVDGEVRFFCQAGYVCRFKLAYSLNGVAKSEQTDNLSVGYEKTYAIPALATNIVASGDWWNGSSWQSLFTKSLPRPTYIGYTAYGTVFDPQYKDEYPEISNITAPANTLTFTQGGGYAATVLISYTQAGRQVNAVDESSVGIGWRKEVSIPADATNIRLYARTITGLAWEPRRTIIDYTWPVPPNVCIKVYGTTLDPTYNNECK